MLKFKISYGLQGNDNFMFQGDVYKRQGLHGCHILVIELSALSSFMVHPVEYDMSMIIWFEPSAVSYTHLIVAAALKNGTVLRYVAELPEEKRKILYVDTEQSHYQMCIRDRYVSVPLPRTSVLTAMWNVSR